MNNWKIAVASPALKPADVAYNTEQIVKTAKEASAQGAEILVFPQLALTGATCGDLFGQTLLQEAVQKATEELAEKLPADMLTVVGAPVLWDEVLTSGALCYHGGKLWLTVAEDDEEAVYLEAPEGITCSGIGIAFDDGLLPVASMDDDVDVLLCLAANPYTLGDRTARRDLLRTQSQDGPLIAYAAAGMGESSMDGVYAGDCYVAAGGKILAESPLFSLEGSLIISDTDVEEAAEAALAPASPAPTGMTEDTRPHPFLPDPGTDEDACRAYCEEAATIQAMGLVRRLTHIGCEMPVIGVSGGLDSSLALLISCRAMDIMGLDHSHVHAITMPGLGTSDTTHSAADDLMEALGVTTLTIPIGEAVGLHLKDIGHADDVFDSAYENAQARERTQILMDYANMHGGLVVGTGDLSELSLGWCTYNGDHMSMYGVNGGVPKTLVRYLVQTLGQIMGGAIEEVTAKIVGIPISPELLPPDQAGDIAQKTEDLVGPYELHDFFLYHTLCYGEDPATIFELANKAFGAGAEGTDGAESTPALYDAATIKKWLATFYKRFFASQFKRSCMPDGVKVFDISLSPRGDWDMPSDASAALWLAAVEDL